MSQSSLNLSTSIKAGASLENSSVTATGQLVDIINDSDKSSFGIGSDDDLKQAVEKSFGKRPNNVFLHSPTPCGDQCRSEAQKVPKPKKAKKEWIMGIINAIVNLLCSCIGCDARSKRANDNKYSCKQPYDAFTHSPTRCGDLYKTNGWSQVQRVLEPKKAEVLGVTTRPTIVSSSALVNTSRVPATFSTRISELINNTVSNQWSKSSIVNVGQSINYKIGLPTAGAGGATNIGFTKNWGENETVTKQTTLSTETAVSVVLQPGESVKTELSASLGSMRVRITYEAYLKGQIACSYSHPFKGNQFHGRPIGEILGYSKVPITEDIQVRFYSNATCEVKDVN